MRVKVILPRFGWLVLNVFLVAASPVVAEVAGPPHYTITDLGRGRARAINDKGQVLMECETQVSISAGLPQESSGELGARFSTVELRRSALGNRGVIAIPELLDAAAVRTDGTCAAPNPDSQPRLNRSGPTLRE
ncbi:MAG TPA: hypothetical protein VFJ58_18195 [Armatimonadota bacterium]|nr:hypothetical protein [Armatimonadota bacterium]